MKKMVLKKRGDINRLASEFNVSTVTVYHSLNYNKPNSLVGYKIREYAKEHLGAVDVEFKED